MSKICLDNKLLRGEGKESNLYIIYVCLSKNCLWNVYTILQNTICFAISWHWVGVQSTVVIHCDKDIKSQIKSHQSETEQIHIGWDAIPFYFIFIDFYDNIFFKKPKHEFWL